MGICLLKRRLVLLSLLLASMACAGAEEPRRYAVAEPFDCAVLTDGLDFPWEMIWGPDGKLWVTERTGLRITRIDPETGAKKTAISIPAAYPGPQHEGVLGIAFDPGFAKSGGDYLYCYYTCKDKNSEKRWGRLVRFAYDAEKESLGDEKILLDRIPAGDDHNAGRLLWGPDDKLYLSLGEQGHNQGKNACLPIEAQRLPTQAELENKDWDSYRGKILRIDPDGGVPSDNPSIKGVLSHVYSYGHRNPQGLAFAGNALYSCEHGPSSDDELNLIEAGGNYGWPHVAGFRDGNAYKYANWSQAANCKDLPFDPNVIPEGVPVDHELEWYAVDFKAPLKTFYTVRDDYDFRDSKCGEDSGYLCYPTIAPSSVVWYPADGAIPSWRGSLLITTLKTGAIFRVKMSGDLKQVQGDYDKFFRSQNRYRVACLDPEGRRLFVACDNSGGVRDDEGAPADSVRDPGAILVFTYRPDAK